MDRIVFLLAATHYRQNTPLMALFCTQKVKQLSNQCLNHIQIPEDSKCLYAINFIFSLDYAPHTGFYCSLQEAMNSTNLDESMQECNEKEDCEMFYDYCGSGDHFRMCSVTSSSRQPSIIPSTCGSILHRIGSNGPDYLLKQ